MEESYMWGWVKKIGKGINEPKTKEKGKSEILIKTNRQAKDKNLEGDCANLKARGGLCKIKERIKSIGGNTKTKMLEQFNGKNHENSPNNIHLGGRNILNHRPTNWACNWLSPLTMPIDPNMKITSQGEKGKIKCIGRIKDKNMHVGGRAYSTWVRDYLINLLERGNIKNDKNTKIPIERTYRNSHHGIQAKAFPLRILDNAQTWPKHNIENGQNTSNLIKFGHYPNLTNPNSKGQQPSIPIKSRKCPTLTKIGKITLNPTKGEHSQFAPISITQGQTG